MKNRVVGLLILILIVFAACDFFDSSAADEAILAADRDNSLDNDFWERKTTFPGEKRANAVLFERDGLIYYGLGHHEDDNALIDMWTYDPDTESWVELDISPPARGDDSCTIYEYNNYVYIVEGWNHDTVWEYDVDAASITLSTLNFSIISEEGLTSAWTDSLVLFGTASYGNYEWWSYSPSTESLEMTKESSLTENYGLRSPAFFTIGDDIYTGGGKCPVDQSEDADDDGVETTAVLDFYKFDTLTENWSEIASLPESAGWVGKGFAIDGTGYVLDEYGKLFSYSTANDEWTELAAFPDDYPLDYHNSTFVVCNGSAYFLRQWMGFGDGLWPGNFSGYLYKYTP
ncbi:MAG: hypothetical protein PQJ61_16085 [Spirochaetales bacterium]|uniref:Galactose oxidase n=1 Tax=Candidatus Thalassospirochaeta sargassi TaxID=3119039 RepID=A0AAJ1IHX4_9SPIO|nr:hypothetical protein [Spirochaetales bacterium]